MDPKLQQCPLCAEEISRTATVCPYCGAKFTVTSNGYCTTCHAVRDANETGLCKTCGNPVADWRVESQLIEEPAAKTPASIHAPTVEPSMPTAQPAVAKPLSRARLYVVAVGIVLLAVIATVAVLGRSRLPAIANLAGNPTQTPNTTSTNPPPAHTPTPLQTYTPTLSPTATIWSTPTITPIPAWVADFAEPLLADISNRRPNLDEDFSGKYGRYAWSKVAGVTVNNGALNMSVTGGGPCTSTRQLNSNDFILQYDLTPKVIDSSGGTGIVFRHTSQNNQDIFCYLNLWDRNWSIGCDNSSGTHEIASGKSTFRFGGRTTTVTLIINGDDMALYLDGQPVGYGQGAASMTGGGPSFCVHAPQATTNVAIDNVKFWDLNNLYAKQD